MFLTTEFALLLGIGFVAQLVDGALGMAYGVLAAPFGGWAVKHIWPRTLMVAVGLLIVVLSVFQLARTFRFI